MEYLVDGIIAGVIIISAILAYSRGFVREVLAIGGWIVAAIVAYLFAVDALPLMQEIPFVGDRIIGDSCQIGIIVSFAVLAVATLIVISLFTPMFSGMIQRSAVGGVDATLGFLFGAARGALLVIVVLIVYDRVVGDEQIAAQAGEAVAEDNTWTTLINESRAVAWLQSAQGEIEAVIPEDVPGWFQESFEELTDECAAGDAPVTAEPAPATDG